jgi:2-dehydro-3-deoxyglucarate aldolase/4-hydroxy-2-oxoheptanedioate aldolase
MRDTVNARFCARVKRREPLLGTVLSFPSPEIAELMAAAGFDWLFIDLEHGQIDFATAQRMVQAAGDCPCIVRVATGHAAEIGKALDTGAAGVIIPHVNSGKEAAAAASAAKYPPEGDRSIGASRAQGYGRTVTEEVASANAETLVVPQVEHVAAVRAVDAIAGAPGTGAVFIGPFDLSASLGRPGAIGDPEVTASIAKVVEACKAAGMPCGIFVVDAAGARDAFAAGHSLVCVSTDSIILGRAASVLVTESRPRST